MKRKHLLHITDPENLPGYTTAIPVNFWTDHLNDFDMFSKLLNGYKDIINLRRYDPQWNDHINSMPGDVVPKFFATDESKHWNVIDADANLSRRETTKRKRKTTTVDSESSKRSKVESESSSTPSPCSFTVPDGVKAVSLVEQLHRQGNLTTKVYDECKKVSSYLLLSQAKAITLWHIDFSGTSVLYILLKGCKVNANQIHI